ncbi:hypothetical protein R50073_01090 [Maricurvus nonylphenolicus]
MARAGLRPIYYSEAPIIRDLRRDTSLVFSQGLWLRTLSLKQLEYLLKTPISTLRDKKRKALRHQGE